MSIQGKNIVFTGKISQPRYEFQRLVEEHGGTSQSGVFSNTDYLVVGEKPGSKLGKATLLGVSILTEEQFLKLLEEPPGEEPLTPEQLAEIMSHTIEIECKWCKHLYKQWDDMPNYETCPVCEMVSPVVCPYCSNEATYVTDFKLYYCMLCGTWFSAPFSIRGRTTKHLHMWLKATPTITGVRKKCPCGAKVDLSQEDLEHSKRNYEIAPIWVKQWKEKSRIRDEEEEVQQRAMKFIESLSEEQLEQLERQLSV